MSAPRLQPELATGWKIDQQRAAGVGSRIPVVGMEDGLKQTIAYLQELLGIP